MHFGTPVVPEEYITYTGWSNGTGVKVSGALSTANSSHQTKFRVAGSFAPRPVNGTTTVRPMLSMALTTPQTACRESNRLPL
jgi:hypothetical protein